MKWMKLKNNATKVRLEARLLVYTFSIMLFVFLFEYKSGLNEKIESYFYNYRTIFKPEILSDQIAISIKVTEENISLFNPKREAKITAELIEYIHTTIKSFNPKNIFFVFPFNSLPYSDLDFWKVFEKISSEKISPFVGVLNGLDLETSFSLLPDHLSERIVSASMPKLDSKNEVLSSYKIYSFRGSKLSPSFITKVASMHLNENHQTKLNSIIQNMISEYETSDINPKTDSLNEEFLRFPLNYRSPEHFRSISFDKLDKLAAEIEKKIVIVGFDLDESSRGSSITSRETFYSNTPWTGEKNPPTKENGIFYSESIALAIDNLINGDFLKRSFTWIDLTTLGLTIVITLVSWRLKPELIFLNLSLLYTSIFIFHLICFSYLSIYPNISRVLVYSTFATIVGAFIKSQRTLESRIRSNLRTKSQKDLSKIHEKFLSLLSKSLRDKNKSIAKSINELITKDTNLSLETKKILRSAAAGANELGDYLDGLADFAKIEKGVLKAPKYGSVNLTSICQIMADQCHPQKRGIKINIKNIGSDIIESDELYLKAVVYNIISNAIKYSPKNETVYIAIEEDSRSTSIHIKDNGPGIPLDLHERIFEKFYRVKDDHTFSVKGTGIGLYLTRYFAAVINCQVSVASNPRSGSTFTLLIPKRGRADEA